MRRQLCCHTAQIMIPSIGLGGIWFPQAVAPDHLMAFWMTLGMLGEENGTWCWRKSLWDVDV